MNTGGTALADIVSFFNTQAATSDVSDALTASAVAFRVSMFVIMFVGALAMAVWIGRIAVDIICLVTRGTGAEQKLSKFGTGKAENYANVQSYLKGNLLEIILVIVLITFLITGWLFRLIAMALSGIGILADRLLGLDIAGGLSAMNAQAFIDQVPARRTASLRGQYDSELANARKFANMLYDMAKDGVISDDPQWNHTRSMYTQAMVRADILAQELNNRRAADELRLGADYFSQHLRQSGDGVCNRAFLVQDIMSMFNRSIQCRN